MMTTFCSKSITFSIGQDVYAKFAILNKNNSLEEYREECSHMGRWRWERCRIEKVLEMSAEEYDALACSLLESREAFDGFGGSGSDSAFSPDKFWQFESEAAKKDWFAKHFLCVIIVTAPEREPVAIDPEGYADARYVGLDVRVTAPEVLSPGTLEGRWLTNGSYSGVVESLAAGGRSGMNLICFDEDGTYSHRMDVPRYCIENGSWYWLFANPDWEKLSPARLRELREECAAIDATERQIAETKAKVAREKREALKAEFTRRKPEWAKAFLVAELREYDRTCAENFLVRTVFLAWSKTDRDGFAEMRKAAALFPPTADLATGPKEYEHREKYSMGRFYLSADYFGNPGWVVRKLSGYVPDTLEWDAKE